jgi:hypothetical protein
VERSAKSYNWSSTIACRVSRPLGIGSYARLLNPLVLTAHVALPLLQLQIGFEHA